MSSETDEKKPDSTPKADAENAEDDEDEEDLEKLQAEIARMEAEAARISKETEELEKSGGGNGGNSAAASGSSGATASNAADSAAKDKMSVYVGQVDYSATPEELLKHFEACGTVERITIVCDKYTGRPKGFAYIEFGSETAVENAVKLDGSEFKGRNLKVTHKRVNVPAFQRGGGDGGRGRGRGRGYRGRGGFRGGRGYRGGYRGGRGGYHPYY